MYYDVSYQLKGKVGWHYIKLSPDDFFYWKRVVGQISDWIAIKRG
jgi:hypothetical protein